MSTKSVAEKLPIKQNTSVWVSGNSSTGVLGELPAGVTSAGSPGDATVAVVFAASAAELRTVLGRLTGGRE